MLTPPLPRLDVKWVDEGQQHEHDKLEMSESAVWEHREKCDVEWVDEVQQRAC